MAVFTAGITQAYVTNNAQAKLANLRRAAPLSKPELLTIYVGGSGGYTTTNGTLSITPSGSGLSQLTVTG